MSQTRNAVRYAVLARVRARKSPSRRSLSERERFVARYVAAGVPAAAVNATWWQLTRMRRGLTVRTTIRRARQLTDMIMGPLLARYRVALVARG